MKTRIVSLVVVGVLTGCQPNVEVKNGTGNDLSEFAKKYLQLNNTASIATGSMKNSMTLVVAGALRKSLTAAGVTFSVGRLTADSVYNSKSACRIDTLLHNPDGSSVQIVDYGDSCVHNYGDTRVVYFGKSTSTYKYSNKTDGSTYVTDYSGNSRFKNFGGRYVSKDLTYTWVSNGNYSYSGASRYDTTQQTYSGSSSSADSSLFKYNAESYLHLQNAMSTFDSKKSVTQFNDNQYVYGDNMYHSVVTVPVVTDYACSPYPNVSTGVSSGGGTTAIASAGVVIPVSGHEVVNYEQGGKTGQFEIDYGNGECDTLVTIIEDGKSFTVDLSKLYLEVTTN